MGKEDIIHTVEEKNRRNERKKKEKITRVYRDKIPYGVSGIFY